MTATVTCTARPEGASQTDWAQASIGKLISPPNLNLSGYTRAEMVLRGRIVAIGTRGTGHEYLLLFIARQS